MKSTQKKLAPIHSLPALDAHYWNHRWETQQTAWDMGNVAPTFVEYFKSVKDKNTAILIPGCGNAYEAEFLLKSGFTHITLIDIAPHITQQLCQKFKQFPQVKVLCEDFFTHQGKYDLLLEQTFFCAISPSQRNNYATKAAEILNPNGKIVGLLFDHDFNNQEPPFGGHTHEYQAIFEPLFDIIQMENCKHSIKPRKNKELFIQLKKR